MILNNVREYLRIIIKLIINNFKITFKELNKLIINNKNNNLVMTSIFLF